MTDQNKPGCPVSAEPASARVAQDERFASAVSAYLDGELKGEELAEFEALLRNDEALSREVAGMRRIGRQLTALGADILDEPIPDAMLEALARLEVGVTPGYVPRSLAGALNWQLQVRMPLLLFFCSF